MASSFNWLYYHLIFSTKDRMPWIYRDLEEQIWAYMGGIAKRNEMSALAIGGVEDHVHLAIRIPPKIAVSKAVRFLKGGTSKWIHETFPGMEYFAWQNGYGAFSVGQAGIDRTAAYIKRQRVHHHGIDYKTEVLGYLDKYDIQYDERYLWG